MLARQVKEVVAHNLMRLIAEGAGDEDADADHELRVSAVESYMELLKKPKLPEVRNLFPLALKLPGASSAICSRHHAGRPSKATT